MGEREYNVPRVSSYQVTLPSPYQGSRSGWFQCTIVWLTPCFCASCRSNVHRSYDSRKYNYFFPSYLLIPPKLNSGFPRGQRATAASGAPSSDTLSHPFWDFPGADPSISEEDLAWKRQWRVGAKDVGVYKRCGVIQPLYYIIMEYVLLRLVTQLVSQPLRRVHHDHRATYSSTD